MSNNESLSNTTAYIDKHINVNSSIGTNRIQLCVQLIIQIAKIFPIQSLPNIDDMSFEQETTCTLWLQKEMFTYYILITKHFTEKKHNKK